MIWIWFGPRSCVQKNKQDAELAATKLKLEMMRMEKQQKKDDDGAWGLGQVACGW